MIVLLVVHLILLNLGAYIVCIVGKSGECLIAKFHVSDSIVFVCHPQKVRRMHQCQLSALGCENNSYMILRKSSECINTSFCASIQFEQCKSGKARRWGSRSALTERLAHEKKGSAGVDDLSWLAGSATTQQGLEVLGEILSC